MVDEEKDAAKQRQDEEKAAHQRREDARTKAMAEAEAVHEPTPFSLTHHANGKPRMMTIGRPGGAGQREITADEWDNTYSRAPVGTWEIVSSEVVAPHHSDNGV